MTLYLYCIYDRLAGTFSEPFCSVKEELAIRRFDFTLSNAPMVALDCDLYQVGTLDTISGNILVPEKPVFVKRFALPKEQ